MKIVKLNDVCEIIAGQSPPSKFYNDQGIGLPFFQGKTDFGKLHPSVRMWCSEPKKIAEAGDILISVRAPVGPTNLADQRCCIGRGLSAIRPSKAIDTKFLLQYFKAIEPKISNMGNGSTFSAITQKDLRAIEIPLPPLAEQQRIAAILDKADALRAQRRAALAKLDTLLQATFLHLFGDPVTNPMRWEVKPLENVLSRKPQNGAYYPKESYTDDPKTGVEMVHMSDAFYGIVERGNLKRAIIPETDFEKYGLDENDILIARRSLNYEGSAKPCRIPPSTEQLIFESSLIRITPDLEQISPQYLYHYLANERVRQAFVFPNVTRSTISGINQAGLKRITVLVPDRNAQEDFECFLKTKEVLQKKMVEEGTQLNNLFHALQQRAFNGEI